jgi:hypothetical protein
VISVEHLGTRRGKYGRQKLISLKLIRKIKILEICTEERMNLRKVTNTVFSIIKDENGNLLADPQNVLNRWKDFFNQVLNVCGVHDVEQMDIHTAEPLVPEPSLVEVEIAIGKLKSYKSPGTDQTPAELIKARGETLCSEIRKLTRFIWNKEELPQQWKESTTVPIYKNEDKTGCHNYRAISLLSTAYNIMSNILLARLTPYIISMKLLGIISTGCSNRSIANQIFYILQILQKQLEYNGTWDSASVIYRLQESLWTQFNDKLFTTFCLNLVCLRS